MDQPAQRPRSNCAHSSRQAPQDSRSWMRVPRSARSHTQPIARIRPARDIPSTLSRRAKRRHLPSDLVRPTAHRRSRLRTNSPLVKAPSRCSRRSPMNFPLRRVLVTRQSRRPQSEQRPQLSSRIERLGFSSKVFPLGVFQPSHHQRKPLTTDSQHVEYSRLVGATIGGSKQCDRGAREFVKM
jgi:hypothetical protein